jgi:hypothetical protein
MVRWFVGEGSTSAIRVPRISSRACSGVPATPDRATIAPSLRLLSLASSSGIRICFGNNVGKGDDPSFVIQLPSVRWKSGSDTSSKELARGAFSRNPLGGYSARSQNEFLSRF